ncbi:MAG: twin-arginine translocase subunit TatB [Bosea sp.]|uniref:Sec-independent protein translocase protein TatB n=1 Tax=unclassified Bosea (in: a-proteobacteria) TaxID=2653178 RepID=UPI0009691001|nr:MULTISPECIES: Sec-independent protein translocase protein TatB [unclassified Bosea (in: a-proteobacteria)]MBN9457045.1 twin-arginine translocase subunit TatB [Bosea sp. (in: a-proteobacteria)]OJV09924.1 MAG: twin arginine-targeting protein translocase TatB [Bosea sp. 67-29]
MFDIAWSEMVLIGAVALVVIGPKDLPKVLRTVGQTVGKVRRMAAEFQGQFNEAMREAELADLKKQVEDVGGSVSSALNSDYKPIEEPKDFAAPATEDAAKPVDEAALKEAEAKLAALPAPEMPPPVDIAAEAPAAKPRRARKPKAETVAAAEAAPADAAAAVDEAPAKPARARRVKTAELAAPVDVGAAPSVPEETAPETTRPARKRKPKAAAKGEGSSA